MKCSMYSDVNWRFNLSQEITFLCQKFSITKPNKEFTYLLGAGNPSDIVKIADAPSFLNTTPHREIVDEILNPPTKKWQRPLIEKKIEEIAEQFDKETEIMPNPILLAVNPDSNVKVSKFKNANGSESELYEVRVEVPTQSTNPKPLWIIDGQHRVAGLSKLKKGINTLPFVLLYSDSKSYRSDILAKIFAQVTTQATPLDSIHKAWMQFVFKLEQYKDQSPSWRAMKTTALLCQSLSFFDENNPFYNKVGFNPDLYKSTSKASGFIFDAEELSDLIRQSFFIHAGNSNVNLSEESVSEAIGSSVFALMQVHKGDKSRSAFFGDGNFQQKYFKEGFIVGICAYILKHGIPRNWETVLRNLKFNETNWDVTDWVVDTGGTAGNLSKRIAFDCFGKVFSDSVLPGNANTIIDYLLGNPSSLLLQTWEVNLEGKRITKSKFETEINFADNVSSIPVFIPESHRMIQITNPSKNIGKVEIRYKNSPVDEYFKEFKKGQVISDAMVSKQKSLSLLTKVDYYGDRSVSKTVTLKFE